MPKEAFAPPAPGAGAAPMPPADAGMMDPAMMGGMPPMDPAMMGGMPPMDPAMMGGMPPMDPAMMSGDPAMMGAPAPMPEQVGAVGADGPVAPEGPRVGEMSQDEFKMFLAETLMEVGQGQGAEGGEDIAAEAIGAQSQTNEELMSRVDELENKIALMESDAGMIPADSPSMEAPMMEEAFSDVPMPAQEMPAMPKVAAQRDPATERILANLKKLSLADPYGSDA
jgi:hypothetical protein